MNDEKVGDSVSSFIVHRSSLIVHCLILLLSPQPSVLSTHFPMSNHLKSSATGHLIHGPGGHLSIGCPTGGGGGGGGGGCSCLDTFAPCSLCPGDTPTQFHVSFTGISLCPGCVDCADSGTSMKIDAGSTINGSYILAKNGACGWTTPSADVPCTATFYTGAGCTGSSAPIEFAVDLVRINASTFRLQITDAGGNILIFTADITTTACCAGFTAANANAGCGCSGTPTVFSLGSGGTATVTPC